MARSMSSARAIIRMSASLRNLLGDGKYATASHPNLNYSYSFEDGVEGGQCSRAWQYTGRTLTKQPIDIEGITYDVLDLYSLKQDIGAGAGKDGVGADTEPYWEIVAIAIVCDSVTGNGVLEIMPDGTNGWSPIGLHTSARGGALREGGCLFKCQPDADAFGITADRRRIKLRIEGDTGNTVTYSVYLLARHDVEASSSCSSTSTSSSSSTSLSCSSTSSSTSLSCSSTSTSSSQSA